MGTCAAFGGIPAAPPNPTEASGIQFTLDKPGGLLRACKKISITSLGMVVE